LPIFSWVIEHPEGTVVIDTGHAAVQSKGSQLQESGITEWLTRQTIRFDVQKNSEVGNQLKSLGIAADAVRWVILTQLNTDHTGGLHYFPSSEIVVSREEYIRPLVDVGPSYPPWFKPKLIGYFDTVDRPFEDGYFLTKAHDIFIVPTPGCTRGHQSVIFKTPDVNLFFAGDASFTHQQLEEGVIPGIAIDRSSARATLSNILEFSEANPTVYLPSHDLESVERFFGKKSF
jgi:glyoxylase-like metal-dependent hydrolase (beta-lactamase superfamily II)